jgi:ATP-dependent Lon protease
MTSDDKPELEVEGTGQVLSGDDQPVADEKNIVLARDVFPNRLPIIPVHNRPIFPKMMIPMLIDDKPLKNLISELSQAKSKFVGLVLIRDRKSAEPGQKVHRSDLHTVGVIAEILQVGQIAEDAPIPVMFGALERFRIVSVATEEPFIVAHVNYVLETEMRDSDELKAYSLSIIQSIKELIKLNPLHKEELSLFMHRSDLNEPGRLADFAAAMTTAGGPELQDVLETFSIRARIEKVLVLLKKETDISRLQAQISKQIEEKVSNRQREFFLNEQLKAIKKELGLTKEGPEAEYERFAERLKALNPPEEALERINEEMEKLKLIEPTSPEFNVVRGYVDWLTGLPWGVMTKDSYDIASAAKVLNADHYGLDDVKERILEFLSVGIMKGNIAGSIICFVGPPGVGKTSIGQSIARSIGRKFYRFSLGGMRDEAEIKGHRRTYIGAMPGKFIQAIKVCKSANPVIMLDEIDKIGASYHGDPASALLEVLDPEQNRDFLDHYIDVRFDLSNILFICTANVMDTIPAPLLDRMEIIKLSGYIRQEKMQIAKRFLVPKQFKAHGIKPGAVSITSAALREMIEGYAREPGVRGLENHIKRVLRKSVKTMVESKSRKKIMIDAKDIPGLLGKRTFSDETPFKTPRPGVATGLAWTRMGGDVLYVEATNVATGKPGFKQTGQLGNVMIESSEIAYTYVRSFLNDTPAAREFFQKNFIHLHVPAGATPKDGPSAGITMACCLYSLAMNVAIRKEHAMTGELTLSGLIMPVGGIKEKTIAARRAGIRHLVLPAANRKDFEDLPSHIRKGLKPHFVATFADVVSGCLGRKKK